MHSFPAQHFQVNLRGPGPRFDGIGAVNGGGATSVLLKDYPDPQRAEILDLVFKPKFGASVSTMLVEIPGDGNATQGSMPSHMHQRDDLDFFRGYTWWVMREAKQRNPGLTLDAKIWSAPGWVGDGNYWTDDAIDYLLTWMRGLRDEHGLMLDAVGCRNEKGTDLDFAKGLRTALDRGGFQDTLLHAFDNWPADKFDFLRDLVHDTEARAAIDVIGAHVLTDERPGRAPAHAPWWVQSLLHEWGKPLWNTEDHVYKKGFDCLISIVETLNESFIISGATKTVLWYDIAGVYPVEPYSEDPAMIVANAPWSGHYRVREALWGYAHYGQFTETGWNYSIGGSGLLAGNGSVASLTSPAGDFTTIIETKDAAAQQQVTFEIHGMDNDTSLCVWTSSEREQFTRQDDLLVRGGRFSLTVEPDMVYTLSTTRGQQKGGFALIPDEEPFPLPYRDSFDYPDARSLGKLPRYTADIAGAFELVPQPDGEGTYLRQQAPIPTISWAPDWHPYTIIGDLGWTDYEVSVDVLLEESNETAGVMARINHVGLGYGFDPKGYIFELDSSGECRLIVTRGPQDQGKLIGDAEQQALLAAQDNATAGGEVVLGRSLAGPAEGKWRNLTLRCDGTSIIGLVDGEELVAVEDDHYDHGQAGLLARGPAIDDPVDLATKSVAAAGRLSRPHFSELRITDIPRSGEFTGHDTQTSPLYP